MAILLVAVHIVACFILIVVILIQGGRGQGLTGGSFTGGGVQSLFGTRAADFLTKATSVSAILFLFSLCTRQLCDASKRASLVIYVVLFFVAIFTMIFVKPTL